MRLVVTDNNTEREGTATFGYLLLSSWKASWNKCNWWRNHPLKFRAQTIGPVDWLKIDGQWRMWLRLRPACFCFIYRTCGQMILWYQKLKFSPILLDNIWWRKTFATLIFFLVVWHRKYTQNMFFLQLRLQTKKCKVSWLIMGLENRCMVMTQKHTHLKHNLKQNVRKQTISFSKPLRGNSYVFYFV